MFAVLNTITMAKKKNNLIQSIYKEIEKNRNGKTIVGNANTLSKMKSGHLNPTVNTVRKIMEENGIKGKLVLEYENTTTTINFFD